MKCFYHGTDLDGKCSGAIVKFKHSDTQLFPINYNDAFPFDRIVPGEDVYVVDFSLKPPEMIRLNRLAKLHWIDHHKTAIEAVQVTKEVIGGSRENGLAGCELTWKYLFPNKGTPKVVTLLGRYDVWDKTHSDWEDEIVPFQLGIKTADCDPHNQEFWRSLFEPAVATSDNAYEPVSLDEMIGHIIDDGCVIQRYLDQTSKDRGKTASFEGTFLGKKAIFCNSTGGSRTFLGVYDKQKHDLMCTFSYTSDRQWYVSLFTESDTFDVSVLAKQMGGGGHQRASGFIGKDLSFINS